MTSTFKIGMLAIGLCSVSGRGRLAGTPEGKSPCGERHRSLVALSKPIAKICSTTNTQGLKQAPTSSKLRHVEGREHLWLAMAFEDSELADMGSSAARSGRHH
jgi:hypothetical protein